jgi:antitoxin ParD1/3/4
VNEKVESGLYQTASEVVRETLRLLKERDQAREQLCGDVQAGFDQLARGEGRAYDKASGRPLAELIKSRGRPPRAASANEHATADTRSYVPQGPAGEHPALEQGPGGNPEAYDRRRAAVSNADREPVVQVRERAAQRDVTTCSRPELPPLTHLPRQRPQEADQRPFLLDSEPKWTDLDI